MKESFILYSKHKEVFDSLTDEQSGQLIKGIFEYVTTGKSNLSGLLNTVFIPIKQDLDRNNEVYEAVCERNRINGLKGGRPRKETQKTQSVILETQENPKNLDNDYDNDNEIEKEIYKENVGDGTEPKKENTFCKPTVEEIKAYCVERKNNIDAQNFFDFYESKGWMIGKNKMKDWQASVRTWEQNEKKKNKPQTTQAYKDNTTGQYGDLSKFYAN